MNQKLVISVLVVLCLGTTLAFYVPKLDGRIVGGVDTPIEDIPYQISLEYWNSHACGGVILDENTILTAAHCFDVFDFEDYQNVYRVRVNTSIPNLNGELHQISKIIYHPQFNGTTYHYDIALIRLSSNIIFSTGAQPIGMPAQDEPLSHGDMALVSGFGRLWYQGPLASFLQSVKVTILDENDCIAAYENINPLTPNMFCAGFFEGEIDSCHGDSGGPLVHNGLVIGLVSFGVGCARAGLPGVYTKVASLRDWVDDTYPLLDLA